jgi:hypothetical protein
LNCARIFLASSSARLAARSRHSREDHPPFIGGMTWAIVSIALNSVAICDAHFNAQVLLAPRSMPHRMFRRFTFSKTGQSSKWALVQTGQLASWRTFAVTEPSRNRRKWPNRGSVSL